MKLYNMTIKGKEYQVVIKDSSQNCIKAEVNGVEHVVCIQDIQNLNIPVAMPSIASGPAPVASMAPAVKAPSQTAAAGDVVAPIPGLIKEIHVKEGDSVSAGAKLLVMEAMKMENVITAPQAGKVTKIHVKSGDTVNQDQPMVSIGGN